MTHTKDIKGVTRYTFTHVPTGEVTSGLFMFECSEDGIFIRTDNCPADWESADFGVHPVGLAYGEWTYVRS